MTARERPVPFKDFEVRAILDGRKTQMRRVVEVTTNPNHPNIEYLRLERHRDYDVAAILDPVLGPIKYDQGECTNQPMDVVHYRNACPYGVPGDRLWVRETWVPPHPMDDGIMDRRLCYRATNPDGRFHWKPSIHMPRWASRITLEITAVRVERLQKISEEDADAEGGGLPSGYPIRRLENPYRYEFRRLWNSTGGDWDANPWVWVIEFRRVT